MGADLFVLSEPIWGVDVGARVEIYELLGCLCENGVGIFVVLLDFDEVVGLVDCVYVMVRGWTVVQFEGVDVIY